MSDIENPLALVVFVSAAGALLALAVAYPYTLGPLLHWMCGQLLCALGIFDEED